MTDTVMRAAKGAGFCRLPPREVLSRCRTIQCGSEWRSEERIFSAPFDPPRQINCEGLMLSSTTGLACPRTTRRKGHGPRSMFVNYLTIPNRLARLGLGYAYGGIKRLVHVVGPFCQRDFLYGATIYCG